MTLSCRRRLIVESMPLLARLNLELFHRSVFCIVSMNPVYVILVGILTTASGQQHTSVSQTILLWTAGTFDATENKFVIPYVTSATDFLANQFLAYLETIGDLYDNSCILMKSVTTAPAGDYVEVRELKPTGPCEPTEFGRKPGKNEIIIGAQCTEAQVKRLVMARLGLLYTHQRADRDNYVKIVPSTATGPLLDIPVTPAPALTPYDYDSVMSAPSVQEATIYRFTPPSTLSPLTDNVNFSPFDIYLLYRLYFHPSCSVENLCSTTIICQNGGSCFNNMTGRCECTSFYTGVKCETRINQCTDKSCQNGTCVEGTGTVAFTCECDDYFAGDRCQINLIEAGWKAADNGFQYRLTTSSDHWFNINRECKTYGAELALDGVRDPRGLVAIRNLFPSQFFWVGAVALIDDFQWSDNIGFESTWASWRPGQPPRTRVARCVALDYSLRTLGCSLTLKGLCERPIGNPLTYNNYRPGNGKMYFSTPAIGRYEAVRAQCHERGGHLVVLGANTPATLKNIVDNVFSPSTGAGDIFVGFEDFSSSRQFKAIVGTDSLPAGDPRWAVGEPGPGARRKKRRADTSQVQTTTGNAVTTKLSLNGKLQDVDEDITYGYGLCEAPDLPASNCVCQNGACVEDIATGVQLCNCNFGYRGDMNGNCIDFNECLDPINPCGNGTCLNVPGTYACLCPDGYTIDPDPAPKCVVGSR